MILFKSKHQRFLTILVLVSVSVLLVSLFSSSSMASSKKVFLNVGTTNKASSAYGYYVQLLKVFNKYLAEYYYSQEDEILKDNLKKALARYSRFPEKERIEKLKNYLYRKGFSYSKIVDALAKMEIDYEW